MGHELMSNVTMFDGHYRAARRITLVGALVDLLLGVLKIGVGWVSQSQALIADGVHSFSDLGTDFMVLFAAKQAYREADAEHPYGHARIETAATVGLGLALIGVAFGIAYDAIHRMLKPELLLHPNAWALVVAIVSIVSKEAIYRYTMRYARRLNSSLLSANAWHSRSDAISSAVVVVGVAGSLAGFEYLDALAAVGVSLMIAKLGSDFAWKSTRELIDTGLDPERLSVIRRTIMEIDGVQSLHSLRTRAMGGQALVDVHILVAPLLSVSEAHQISEVVRARLMRSVPEVSDAMVHIDPEDDEIAAPNPKLPLRKDVLDRLHSRWESIDACQDIKNITLHYLDGKIQVEVTLPLSIVADERSASLLSEAFSQAISEDKDFSGVHLLYS